MKKSTIGIIAVLVVLVVVIGIFAGMNRSNLKDVNDGAVDVDINGQVTTYTIDELRDMEGVSTVHKVIKSGSKEDEEADFTGIDVADLLKSVDPDCLEGATAVVATSGDGYATSYSVEEALEDDNVMLIFEQDGAALTPYEDGGSGPLRIVVMKDEFGNRSAMWVTKLSIEK